MTFAGVGANVSLATNLSPTIALFHEGPSRVLVATSDAAALEALAARHNVPALRIGKSQGKNLRIALADRILVDTPIDHMYSTWDRSLEEALHG
jgi:uncharacterized membrane protein